MLTEVLTQLYERDLAKLRTEVEQYPDEADLWRKEGDIPNSAGNLTLHLIGNLKHFIGAILGNSGYIRERDKEFSGTGVPREMLLSWIDETRNIVSSTLANHTPDDLARTYPLEVFGHPMTTEYFLVHLSTHLTYHLGQINYHRRSLSK
ncbi:hypothetical protein BH10ACI3_BH10ACI3_19950 [soil metagenome]